MADILIIDDDNHVGKLYHEFLSRQGYQVNSVQSCDHALRELIDNNYDLVILDIELDNESGLEFLKEIKTRFPELPVILNSAYPVYKSDFTSWLADAFVMKSSDLNPLLEEVTYLTGVKK